MEYSEKFSADQINAAHALLEMSQGNHGENLKIETSKAESFGESAEFEQPIYFDLNFNDMDAHKTALQANCEENLYLCQNNTFDSNTSSKSTEVCEEDAGSLSKLDLQNSAIFDFCSLEEEVITYCPGCYELNWYECDCCCCDCGELESKPPVQERLIKSTKFNSRFFNCKFCDRRFESSSERCKHEKDDHGDFKSHNCNQCDYQCDEIAKMIRHQRMHVGEKPFSCPSCSYKSYDKSKVG